MSTNNGGPAFSKSNYVHRTCDPNEKVITGADGMTLRDYFAAKAMQMLRGDLTPEFIAARAYEIADAMLKAREA